MKLYISILLSAFLFISCSENEITCIRVSGTPEDVERDVENFDRIFYNGVGKVTLTQDTEYKVTISAPPEVIETIETEVRDGELIVNFTRCFNGAPNLEMFITMPDLVSFVMNGTGDIIGNGSWLTDSTHLEMNGTGDIIMDLQSLTSDIEITGSGKIELTGKTFQSNVLTTGTGIFSAFVLESTQCDIVSNSTGNCEVTVLQTLNAELNGTGNVLYKGNPTVNQSGNGTGQVIDRN
ncbi:MAG TPA: hypothetical protein DDY13_08595 [Cytophagales bacterium]|jgi:hypothetical protein|nr:hypothetical protein [Cytophagales bacterium]